jgi:hypothetical protein
VVAAQALSQIAKGNERAILALGLRVDIKDTRTKREAVQALHRVK